MSGLNLGHGGRRDSPPKRLSALKAPPFKGIGAIHKQKGIPWKAGDLTQGAGSYRYNPDDYDFVESTGVGQWGQAKLPYYRLNTKKYDARVKKAEAGNADNSDIIARNLAIIGNANNQKTVLG